MYRKEKIEEYAIDLYEKGSRVATVEVNDDFMYIKNSFPDATDILAIEVVISKKSEIFYDVHYFNESDITKLLRKNKLNKLNNGQKV